jgi:hypothetical protein
MLGKAFFYSVQCVAGAGFFEVVSSEGFATITSLML